MSKTIGDEDVAEFIATAGLRHAYRLSYLTSALVGPGYDDVKRETGLIRGEYLLLLCLSHTPALTAQDVARMTRRPRNSISRSVHRMLEEGYIDRAPDPDDGRAKLATLTDAGVKRLAEVAPHHVATVRRLIFNQLTPSQTKALAAALAPVAGALCDHPEYLNPRV